MIPDPQPPARAPRFVLLAIVLAALLVVAAGALLVLGLHDNARGMRGSLLASAIGGPFEMVDQNGQKFTEANLNGKWHLVFFGFTHCPDACPTTLNEVALAIDQLGDRRGEVGVVFISVDPERDTPEVLKSYVSSFDAPITALSGTPEQVAQVAKAYRVYFAKRQRPDGGYDVDHTAALYVMDPQGRFTATFSPQTGVDAMVERLQQLLS
jgi:protein SCO1